MYLLVFFITAKLLHFVFILVVLNKQIYKLLFLSYIEMRAVSTSDTKAPTIV